MKKTLHMQGPRQLLLVRKRQPYFSPYVVFCIFNKRSTYLLIIHLGESFQPEKSISESQQTFMSLVICEM